MRSVRLVIVIAILCHRVNKRLPPGQRVLWFRAADGKEYVVRDAAVLEARQMAMR